MICARRANQVRTLLCPLLVPGPKHRSAEAVSPWERIEVLAHGINGMVKWVLVVWSIRRRSVLSVLRRQVQS